MIVNKNILMASLLMAVTTTTTNAFMVLPCAPSTMSSSRLFISSWTDTASDRRSSNQQRRDPEKYIQDYIPAPEAVEARTSIQGTLLLSSDASMFEGTNNSRQDQFLLDLLNHQESAFEYDTFQLIVQDAVKTKKSLLSRSARYTGLLDKLAFTEMETTAEATTSMTWPTAEQLQDSKVTTWLVVIDHAMTNGWEACQTIGTLMASAASNDNLENVAVLITNVDTESTLDPQACQTAIQALASNTNNQKIAYTVVAVGSLHDGPEGATGYQYHELNDDATASVTPTEFSREEAFRVVTELLQLECGKNKALLFTELDMEQEINANATETKLIKGLREAGYARMQEIAHMIEKGPKSYNQAIDEWRNRNPDWDKGFTTDIWWEAPEYKESRARSDARAERLAALEDEVLQSDIQVLAKEWARRDYFTQTVSGSVDSSTVSEEEFIQQNWERAMKEGEWAYRKSRGELTDEEKIGEMKTFQEQQALKQEVMLKRAKDELAEVMNEDLTEDSKDDADDEDKDGK